MERFGIREYKYGLPYKNRYVLGEIFIQTSLLCEPKEKYKVISFEEDDSINEKARFSHSAFI